MTWGPGNEQHIYKEQFVTDSLNLCNDFLEEKWAMNHSTKVLPSAQPLRSGSEEEPVIYLYNANTHTGSETHSLTLTHAEYDLNAAAGFNMSAVRLQEKIVESFPSRAKNLWFFCRLWTLQPFSSFQSHLMLQPAETFVFINILLFKIKAWVKELILI